MTNPSTLNNAEHDALQSILDELASGAPAAPAAPAHPTSAAPARYGSSSAPNRFYPTDVAADANRLRQSPSAKVGIYDMIKAKLVGDDSYREATQTMAKRVKMANLEQETEQAIFLALAIRLAGFDGVTGALNYMHSRLKGMEPGSPEQIVAQEMMEAAMREFPELVTQIGKRGTDGVLKAGGL